MADGINVGGGTFIPFLGSLANKIREQRNEAGDVTGYKAASPLFSSLIGGGFANTEASRLNERIRQEKYERDILELQNRLAKNRAKFGAELDRETAKAEQAARKDARLAELGAEGDLEAKKAEIEYEAKKKQMMLDLYKGTPYTPENAPESVKANLRKQAEATIAAATLGAQTMAEKARELNQLLSSDAGKIALRMDALAGYEKSVLENKDKMASTELKESEAFLNDAKSSVEAITVSGDEAAFRPRKEGGFDVMRGPQAAVAPTQTYDMENKTMTTSGGSPAKEASMKRIDMEGFVPPGSVLDKARSASQALGGALGVGGNVNAQALAQSQQLADQTQAAKMNNPLANAGVEGPLQIKSAGVDLGPSGGLGIGIQEPAAVSNDRAALEQFGASIGVGGQIPLSLPALNPLRLMTPQAEQDPYRIINPRLLEQIQRGQAY